MMKFIGAIRPEQNFDGMHETSMSAYELAQGNLTFLSRKNVLNILDRYLDTKEMSVS